MKVFINSNMNETENCRNNSTGFKLLPLIFLPLLSLLINTVVILAAVLYRKRLRQNTIYIYVTSTLIANLVFTILSLYELVNYFEEGDTDNESLSKWRVIRRSFTTSMFLVINSNITVLAHAIRSGAYVIANVMLIKPKSKSTRRLAISKQRTKAYLLVILIWTLPLLLSMSASLIWNCANISTCSILNQTADRNVVWCSRVWAPMSNVYLVCVVGVWLIETLALIWMIVQTARHSELFKHLRSDSSSKNQVDCVAQKPGSESPPLSNINGACDCGTLDSSSNESHNSRENISNNTAESKTKENGTLKLPARRVRSSGAARRRNMPGHKQRRRHARWFLSATRIVTYISSVFFLFTAPAMVVILLDTFSSFGVSLLVADIMFLLPLLYCIISAVLLAKDLGGLKMALQTFFLKCATKEKSVFRNANGYADRIRQIGSVHQKQTLNPVINITPDSNKKTNYCENTKLQK